MYDLRSSPAVFILVEESSGERRGFGAAFWFSESESHGAAATTVVRCERFVSEDPTVRCGLIQGQTRTVPCGAVKPQLTARLFLLVSKSAFTAQRLLC